MNQGDIKGLNERQIKNDSSKIDNWGSESLSPDPTTNYQAEASNKNEFDNGKDVKITNTEVFSSYVILMLRAANIEETNVNKLKATVYLCIVQMACLHVVSNGGTAIFMDSMLDDVKDSILELKVKVKDLVSPGVKLKKLLNGFPSEFKINGDTTINGLMAFEAIYSQDVQELMKEITNHSGGPMGVHGYGAIKFLEAMRGEDDGEENLTEVLVLLQQMTAKVIEALH